MKKHMTLMNKVVNANRERVYFLGTLNIIIHRENIVNMKNI